jgi:hypothetical protein
MRSWNWYKQVTVVALMLGVTLTACGLPSAQLRAGSPLLAPVARSGPNTVRLDSCPWPTCGPVFPSPLRGEGQGEGVRYGQPCCSVAPPLSISLPQGERGPLSGVGF